MFDTCEVSLINYFELNTLSFQLLYGTNNIVNLTFAVKLVKNSFNRGATIAQWIRLRLSPGFESQAHHQRFYQFIFDLCHVEKTKINKMWPGMAHFKNSFNKISKVSVHRHRLLNWPHL